jgi:tRNA nucleotidyltransferase (CCA-adding enzyme)
VISHAAAAALEELVARADPSIVGLVLSGSAARGDMSTEHSDVDVYVVRDDDVERETLHTAIDEIYWSVGAARAPARRTGVVGRLLPA